MTVRVSLVFDGWTILILFAVVKCRMRWWWTMGNEINEWLGPAESNLSPGSAALFMICNQLHRSDSAKVSTAGCLSLSNRKCERVHQTNSRRRAASTRELFSADYTRLPFISSRLNLARERLAFFSFLQNDLNIDFRLPCRRTSAVIWRRSCLITAHEEAITLTIIIKIIRSSLNNARGGRLFGIYRRLLEWKNNEATRVGRFASSFSSSPSESCDYRWRKSYLSLKIFVL